MRFAASPDGPPVVEAARHRLAVSWPGACHDLLGIQFDKDQLFVHLAYYPRDAPALMNRVELPAGERTHTFVVAESADATTVKVKYTHHSDGEAHFSQHSGVYTTIRNRGAPLSGSPGHIFTVEVAGLSKFRKSRIGKGAVSGRLGFADRPYDPMHLAGYWLTPDRTAGMRNPVWLTPDGDPQQGVAFAPPPDSPLRGSVLVITYREGLPAMAVEPGQFRFAFLGGFGDHLANPAEASSFILLSSPVDDISTLRLVDYVRNVQSARKARR